jgi:hypothetical protein
MCHLIASSVPHSPVGLGPTVPSLYGEDIEAHHSEGSEGMALSQDPTRGAEPEAGQRPGPGG